MTDKKITRRSFLVGSSKVAALITAPVFIKIENLMPLYIPPQKPVFITLDLAIGKDFSVVGMRRGDSFESLILSDEIDAFYYNHLNKLQRPVKST